MTAYYNASDTWMIFRAVLNNSILQLDWNALSKPMFILLFISNGCESDCFFLSVFRESLWKASLEIIIWCPSCQWMRKKGKELQLKNLPPSSVLYAASLIHAICHHYWSIYVDTTTRLTTWTTGYGGLCNVEVLYKVCSASFSAHLRNGVLNSHSLALLLHAWQRTLLWTHVD